MALQKLPYRPNSQKCIQLMLSGLVSIVAMTLLSFFLQIFIPTLDFAGQWGAILNGQVQPVHFEPVWWQGLGWHVLNGIFLFPFVFDFLAHKSILTHPRTTKGASFGIGIWLVTTLLIAPIAGQGVLLRFMPQPVSLLFTSLLCWMAYGILLEAMTRVRIVHTLRRPQSQDEHEAERVA